MLTGGFYRFSVHYFKVLNRPCVLPGLYKRFLSDGRSQVPREAAANHKRTSYNKETPGSSTDHGPDRILIEHEKRRISISVYGIPRLSNDSKVTTQLDKERLAERLKLITSVASDISTSDCVYLGVGRDDLKLIACFLRGEQEPGTAEKHHEHESNATKNAFGHYIPVMTSVLSNKIPCVGIGRNGEVKTTRIMETILNSKLEIPQWLYLQLKHRDLCSSKEALVEASQLIPRIYYAFVTEESFYSMCRLHEEVFTQSIFPNKNNVEIAVVVEEWIRPELSKLVKNELPTMLEKKTPPLKLQMDRIDNRSLGARHLVSALILLAPIILGVPSFCIWIARKIRMFKDTTKILYKGDDPHDKSPSRD